MLRTSSTVIVFIHNHSRILIKITPEVYEALLAFFFFLGWFFISGFQFQVVMLHKSIFIVRK